MHLCTDNAVRLGCFLWLAGLARSEKWQSPLAIKRRADVAPKKPQPLGGIAASVPPVVNVSQERQELSKHALSPPPPPLGASTVMESTLIKVGCLLAANSGFLNGLALSSFPRSWHTSLATPAVESAVAVAAPVVAAVSSVPRSWHIVATAWTTSALAVASSMSFFPVWVPSLCVIGSYCGVSFLNGLLHPNGFCWNKAPIPLFLCASLVLVSYYVAVELPPSSFLASWFLLAATNGIQNNWTGMLLPANGLRTANVSGITSDLGIIAGQGLRGNATNVWKFKIFAALVSSFWIGVFVSVAVSDYAGIKSVWLSAASYLGMCTFFAQKGPIHDANSLWRGVCWYFLLCVPFLFYKVGKDIEISL
jgi:hypothetical protein